MNQAKPTHAATSSEHAPLARRSGWSTLFDRWHRLRNRLLASEKFQRWSVAIPFVRWIATRRATQLFDLCAGFVYSQVLYACVRLDLFEQLADGPRSPRELARNNALPAANMHRLLDAAVSLGLLQRRGGGLYGLGMLGAALRGNPGVARMIEHHPMLYRDLADPLPLLRGELPRTELGEFWAYSSSKEPGSLDGDRVARYSNLMAESQQFIAGDVLDAYDFGRHRTLMDVGGGEGAFLAAAGAAHPSLELMLFDLPAVAQRARGRLRASGLAERATVVGGDLFSDPLPAGADVISLVRIIHDHDDGPAMEILRAAHRALPAGGTLLLAEPMARTRGALPMGDAYFGLYLLAMGHGRPRTRDELGAMLTAAGFRAPKRVRTRRPMLTQLLVTTRI